MSDPTPESVLVLLTRIEGKQDVANEKLSAVKSTVYDLSARVSGHSDAIAIIGSEIKVLGDHSNRIKILETESYTRAGERHGLALGGKGLWLIMGGIPAAIVVGILTKVFGH